MKNMLAGIFAASTMLFPASFRLPADDIVYFNLGRDPRSAALNMISDGTGPELSAASAKIAESEPPRAIAGDRKITRSRLSSEKLLSGNEISLGRSGERTIRLPGMSPDGLVFAVVGDVQGKGRSDKWRKTSEWLAARKPFLFVPVGDIVDKGLVWSQWEAFFSDAKSLLETSYIMPVIGNHDCYLDSSKGLKPEVYLQLFDLPDNGCEGYKGYWYAFEAGDAHFSVLCNYPHGGPLDEKTAVDKIQTEWLDKQLAATEKKWKFVFFHAPIWSSGPHGGDSVSLAKTWGAAMERRAVDIVFTGHTHAWEITHPLKNGKHGSGGTVYYNTGGINYSAKANGADFTRVRQDVEREIRVALVKISGKDAVVSTYNMGTGELDDEFKIQK